MVKALVTVGAVLLILASILELVADVGGMDLPEFLPAALSDLPPSDPVTALGLGGVLLVALGTLLNLDPLPGGRLLVAVVSLLAFLLAGGFLFGSGEEAGS